MNFIRKNIWEIERSTGLTYLGALISALHLATYFFWSKTSWFLSSGSPLFCWEFFSQCQDSVLLTFPAFTTIVSSSYFLFSALPLVLFLSFRFISLAWTMLTISALCFLLILGFDQGLYLNFYVLFLTLTFSYLFIPNKALLARYLIFLYYIGSGIQNLSVDWLSGATIAEHFPFPSKGLEWVAAFTVLIQLTIPFLLISRDGQRMGYGVGAFFVFHAMYFYFTRAFDHLGMLLLTSFFIFDFFERTRLERESLYQSYEHPEPSKISWPVVFALVIGAQLPMTKNTYLDILRLQPPKAYAGCEQVIFIKKDNRLTRYVPEDTAIRVRKDLACHPMVAYSSAQRLCEKQNENVNIQVTSFFSSQRLTETSPTLIFASKDFCEDEVSFISKKIRVKKKQEEEPQK